MNAQKTNCLYLLSFVFFISATVNAEPTDERDRCRSLLANQFVDFDLVKFIDGIHFRPLKTVSDDEITLYGESRTVKWVSVTDSGRYNAAFSTFEMPVKSKVDGRAIGDLEIDFIDMHAAARQYGYSVTLEPYSLKLMYKNRQGVSATDLYLQFEKARIGKNRKKGYFSTTLQKQNGRFVKITALVNQIAFNLTKPGPGGFRRLWHTASIKISSEHLK